MRASIGVAILLVPVLVLGGAIAALAVATDDYEQRRVAAEGYDGALAASADVRESALRSLDRYFSLASEAKTALAAVVTLSAVDSTVLDATTTAALTPLGNALTSALPDATPTLEARPAVVHVSDPEALAVATSELVDWSNRTRQNWTTHDSECAQIDAALHEVRTGIMAVAGSVAATGRSILDVSGSASTQSRMALSDAMAHVAAHVEDGTDPTTDLAAYVAAATAVQVSHADAVAAAEAAARNSAANTFTPPRTITLTFCVTLPLTGETRCDTYEVEVPTRP